MRYTLIKLEHQASPIHHFVSFPPWRISAFLNTQNHSFLAFYSQRAIFFEDFLKNFTKIPKTWGNSLQFYVLLGVKGLIDLLQTPMTLGGECYD